MTFCKVFLGIFRRFSKKFMKFFRGLKACIHDTLFAHYAKCFTKNLKKVIKKVLTLPCPRGIIYKSPGYSDKHKQQSCEQTQQSEP